MHSRNNSCAVHPSRAVETGNGCSKCYGHQRMPRNSSTLSDFWVPCRKEGPVDRPFHSSTRLVSETSAGISASPFGPFYPKKAQNACDYPAEGRVLPCPTATVPNISPSMVLAHLPQALKSHAGVPRESSQCPRCPLATRET